MTRSLRRLVLATCAAALPAALPLPALAQGEPVPARVFGGAGFLVASPTGEFEENVGTGFGVGFWGRLPLGAGSPLGLRADFGFLNYGNETIRICVTLPCRVTGEITTSNNIFFAGLGPELGFGNRVIRFYGGASAGLAYFSTTSSVEGENQEGSPFASSTNFDDVTFAWTAGGGVQSHIWSNERHQVRLDLGLRYHGNGEARYLRKGDVIDEPDGSVTINPQQSDTNLWTLHLGASVSVP